MIMSAASTVLLIVVLAKTNVAITREQRATVEASKSASDGSGKSWRGPTNAWPSSKSKRRKPSKARLRRWRPPAKIYSANARQAIFSGSPLPTLSDRPSGMTWPSEF